MKIRTYLDDILDNLQLYITKVAMNRSALFDMARDGGVVTINISQTQIRGVAKHKDGTETKLKTLDIKVTNSQS